MPLPNVFQAGRAATFPWVADRCPDESVTPSLTIQAAAGDITGGMTRIRANASTTALSNDRKTLTTTGIDDVEGHAGVDDGSAFFKSAEGGIIPVTVTGIDDSAETVTLAEALPKGVDAAGGTLVWATWVFALLAPQMVAQRDVAWQVAWSETTGGDGRLITRLSTGTLDIVARPFETGLSHHRLLKLYPWLAARQHQRQEDFGPQIEATLMEMQLRLDAALVERDLDANDVDGSRLLLAHAAAAAAMIAEKDGSPDQIQGLLARSERLFKDGMAAIWADADRDGAIDSGEVGRQLGPRRNRVGGSASGAPTRTFTRGMGW